MVFKIIAIRQIYVHFAIRELRIVSYGAIILRRKTKLTTYCTSAIFSNATVSLGLRIFAIHDTSKVRNLLGSVAAVASFPTYLYEFASPARNPIGSWLTNRSVLGL